MGHQQLTCTYGYGTFPHVISTHMNDFLTSRQPRVRTLLKYWKYVHPSLCWAEKLQLDAVLMVH